MTQTVRVSGVRAKILQFGTVNIFLRLFVSKITGISAWSIRIGHVGGIGFNAGSVSKPQALSARCWLFGVNRLEAIGYKRRFGERIV